MDSLIAVGSTASLLYGLFVIFRMSYALGQGDMAVVEGYMHDLYFESAGMIPALVTVGKYLETLSKRRTGDALDKLKDLAPPTAIVLVGGEEIERDSSELLPGDIVVVKAGASVPADAVVLSGHAFVDESAVSGESVPVEKTEGSELIGGTVNRTGHLTARVTATGGDSMLAKIIKDRLACRRISFRTRLHLRGERAGHLLSLRAGAGDSRRGHGGHGQGRGERGAVQERFRPRKAERGQMRGAR